MPSWNIHIAQTERLLERTGALANSVRDRNAFLFGCVVPDIFVGYMVPGIADPIPYRITHFAKPEPIPKPRAHEFWDGYVVPLLHHAGCGSCVETTTIAQERERVNRAEATSIVEERERLNRVHYPQRYRDAEPVVGPGAREFSLASEDVAQSLLDLTLGVWSHLVADTVWNTRVNQYLEAHGGKPCEEFRIKKQGDFDWFGKTLGIVSIPRATDRLYTAATRFGQYPIHKEYVLKTIGVMHEIVRENPGEPDHPPYRLLTEEFFDATFTEVIELTETGFAARVAAPDVPAVPLIASC